jgi:outer membrane lipoprotein SlyB
MKRNIIFKAFSCLCVTLLLSGCGRDLSNSMYVSSSTTSFTLEGYIVSVRPVTIKENDKLGDNTTGMLAGGAMGAALGSTMGGGSGKTAAIVGVGIAGGILGALTEQALSKNAGMEYVVKVDVSKIKDTYYEGNAALRNIISAARVNSGLLTIVQSAENPLGNGQKVYVVFSDNRTRVIPAQ